VHQEECGEMVIIVVDVVARAIAKANSFRAIFGISLVDLVYLSFCF